MEYTWKSAIERDSMVYLRPNPFYEGVVRIIMNEQKVKQAMLSALLGLCVRVSWHNMLCRD